MSIHCVIPAKGTSLAIKEKNLQKISGQSLLGISMKYAESLPNILNIVISTDSQNVVDEICRSISIDSVVLEDIDPDAVKKLTSNFSLHRRLEQHSTSDSKTAEFLPSILKQISASSEDFLLLLQPTSPFRSPEDFDSLRLLIEGADSVISAKLFDSPHPEKRIKSDRSGFLNKSLRWNQRRQTLGAVKNPGSITSDDGNAFVVDGQMIRFFIDAVDGDFTRL